MIKAVSASFTSGVEFYREPMGSPFFIPIHEKADGAFAIPNHKFGLVTVIYTEDSLAIGL